MVVEVTQVEGRLRSRKLFIKMNGCFTIQETSIWTLILLYTLDYGTTKRVSPSVTIGSKSLVGRLFQGRKFCFSYETPDLHYGSMDRQNRKSDLETVTW